MMIMKRFFNYALIAIAAFSLTAFVACDSSDDIDDQGGQQQEDENNKDNDNDDPIDTTYNVDDFILEHKEGLKQEFDLNTSELPKTITFDEGMMITIYPGTFTKDGIAIDGDFKIEFYEMLRPSSMIFTSTNTNYMSQYGRYYFESDGFFYINATQGGQDLDKYLSQPIYVAIPTDKEGEWTMIWKGDENAQEEDQFAWREMNEDENGKVDIGEVVGANGYFSFSIGSLGWINCDVEWNMGSEKTTIYITITGQFGDLATYLGGRGDTFIFFRAKGLLVLVQIYTADGENRVKSYDNGIPVGAEGMLVGYSIKEGKYSYGEKEITIERDMNLEIDLQETTKEELEASIKALDTYGE